MKRYTLLTAFIMVSIMSCASLTREKGTSHFNSTIRHGNNSTFTRAELEDLLERHESLQGRAIEVTAPITHFEERDAPVWFLVLEKSGKKIRCYEDNYRRFVPPNALYLVRWATHEGGEVTVRGKLKPWGIELTQLTYKNLVVNTDDPPS